VKPYVTIIGDHLVHITANSASFLLFLKEHFPPTLSEQERKPDLVIRIEGGYGEKFQNYNVQTFAQGDIKYFQRSDYLIEANQDYSCATISVHDDLALKHALMNLYSSFIVHHNWGLMIHSSCAIGKEGLAHLFAGHSGDGKSTVAALSRPRTILSDEATLVRINNGQPTIYNSPFRSDSNAMEAIEAGPIPLASIQILRQAVKNHRTKTSKADAFLQLTDKIFYWRHSSENLGALFSLLRMLIGKVPVYELHFQKNDSFWELIS